MSKLNWIEAQKRTFENWINFCLRSTDYVVHDIRIDLKSSIFFYALYKELTGKTIKTYDKNPKHKIQFLGNLNDIINSFKDDNVRLVNIEGEDIYDENLKIILGLIWMLIQRYHIIGSSSNGSSKKVLLEFVNKLVQFRKVHNFQSDWRDGEVLSSLINAIEPGIFPKEMRPEDSIGKITKSLDLAENKMNVPKLIEASYISDAVDELSLMTYTTYLKKKYEENSNKVCPEKCVATGDILRSELNNEESPFTFQVELRNIYDEICPIILEENPKKDVDTKISGPETVQLNTSQLAPGLFEITFDAVHPGEYSADVTIEDEGASIKNSPFNFKVNGSDVSVTGNGVESGKYSPESEKTVSVDSRTKSGGLFEQKSFVLNVTDSKGNNLPVEVKDNEDGTYLLSYLPVNPGVYKVSLVTWGEERFYKEVEFEEKESEFNTKTSIINVSGEIKDKRVFPDNRATGLVVEVEDASGRKISDRKVDVVVTNSEGEISGITDIQEKPDGIYEANIDEITDEGEYKIQVLLDGELKEEIVASCIKGTQPEMVQGTFTFEVHARDKKGELKTIGGDIWEVKIKGPEGADIDVETKDLEDGRYTAKYSLQVREDGPSTFEVSARLNGEHVSSSPFKHHLSPKPSVAQRIKNFFRRSE